jgi:hypothetical protein
MKTFYSDGVAVTVPDITVAKTDPVTFQIAEGQWTGVMFTITDIKVDDDDENILHYNLSIVNDQPPASVDNIKQIVDNFLLSILHDQIKRLNDERSDAE